jgi:hypothetical protein
LLLAPAASAQTSPVGVVTRLDGTATITRTTLPTGTPLRFRDPVFQADRVMTGEASLARILLGGKALVTVRERSVLTIMERPDVSTIDVESGRMGIAVVKERMRPGESVEIRTPNAMATIRGTVVVTEVSQASTTDAAGGSGVFTTTITVLRGLVDVKQVDGLTLQPLGPTHSLGAMQSIRLTGAVPPRPIQAISQEDGRRLVREFRGTLPRVSGPHATVVEGQVHHAATTVSRIVERSAVADPADVRSSHAGRHTGAAGSAAGTAFRSSEPDKPASRDRAFDRKPKAHQGPSRR